VIYSVRRAVDNRWETASDESPLRCR